MRVRRERAASGTDFSSPAKRYKASRQLIVVDDFDREAIRRRIYQVYEAKEHLTLSKLLVRKYFLSFWIVKKMIACVLASATREFTFQWRPNVIAKIAEGDGV